MYQIDKFLIVYPSDSTHAIRQLLGLDSDTDGRPILKECNFIHDEVTREVAISVISTNGNDHYKAKIQKHIHRTSVIFITITHELSIHRLRNIIKTIIKTCAEHNNNALCASQNLVIHFIIFDINLSFIKKSVDMLDKWRDKTSVDLRCTIINCKHLDMERISAFTDDGIECLFGNANIYDVAKAKYLGSADRWHDLPLARMVHDVSVIDIMAKQVEKLKNDGLFLIKYEDFLEHASQKYGGDRSGYFLIEFDIALDALDKKGCLRVFSVSKSILINTECFDYLVDYFYEFLLGLPSNSIDGIHSIYKLLDSNITSWLPFSDLGCDLKPDQLRRLFDCILEELAHSGIINKKSLNKKPTKQQGYHNNQAEFSQDCPDPSLGLWNLTRLPALAAKA